MHVTLRTIGRYDTLPNAMNHVGTREIDQLFSDGNHFAFKKDTVLIRPDEPPFSVYKLDEGFVKVYSLTVNGEEKLHIIHKPGELFPLLYTLRGIHKNIFYQALNDIKVSKVSRKSFFTYIQGHPDAMYDVLISVTDLYDIFRDRVDNLEISHAYPRIIARLLYLAKRFGNKEGKKVTITVPLTHGNIASSIVMTRETASREIERLSKKKLLIYDNHFIMIPDITKLEIELSTYYKREAL